MNLHHLIVPVLAAWLAGCGLFVTTEDDDSAAKGPEAVLGAEVKRALIGASEVHGAAIGVEVAGDTVTLTGFVETAAERDRAVRAAERVEGVGRVIDRIEVRGTGT